MRSHLGQVLMGALGLVSMASGVDIPGGLTRSAERFEVGSYQLVVSPGFTIAPGGAYLSAELRHQTNEDFGVGFGFGAGEVGFNFGFNGVWHLLPDSGSQPAIAILAGMYMNRVQSYEASSPTEEGTPKSWNYFAIKVAPTISKRFPMEWGSLTPYAGMHLTPSFRLAEAANGFSVKSSMGTELQFSQVPRMHFWTEMGIGLVNSTHEVIVGIAYPFDEVRD